MNNRTVQVLAACALALTAALVAAAGRAAPPPTATEPSLDGPPRDGTSIAAAPKASGARSALLDAGAPTMARSRWEQEAAAIQQRLLAAAMRGDDAGVAAARAAGRALAARSRARGARAARN